MIQRPFFVFCVIFLFAGFLSAQRTVTNSDLEKYKQQRLEADKEYHDNYQRLGMPSPEELEKRREASRAETERLYDKLRAERLEAARLNAIEAAAAAQMSRSTQFVPFPVPYGDRGYGFYSNPGFLRFNRRGRVNQGYAAGGQFWTTGPRTFSQPILKIGRGNSSIRVNRR